jgi:hypothetical protein
MRWRGCGLRHHHGRGYRATRVDFTEPDAYSHADSNPHADSHARPNTNSESNTEPNAHAKSDACAPAVR